MLRLFRQYYPIRNVFFIIGEFLLIYGAVLMAAGLIHYPDLLAIDVGLYLKAFLIAMVCQTCLYYNDLYDLAVINSFSELGIRLLQALGAAAIFLAIIYFILPEAIIGRGVFALSVGITLFFVIFWRFCYTLALRHGLLDQKIILLGWSELGVNIVREIAAKRDCGYTIGAVVRGKNGENAHNEAIDPRFLVREDFEGLCELAKDLGIKKIVVALHERRGAFPMTELLKCRVDGIEIIEGNTFYEMLTGRLIVSLINPAWLIFSDGFKKSRGHRFFKRMTDLIFSALLLIPCLPIILLTAMLIKIDSRGPVIFSQERVGEKRKPFMVHKFRSMVADAEKKSGPVWAKTDDDRVTRVGHFIRKLRIDEIPQLWNVLMGEMSFVGPRPERAFFVKKLEDSIPYYGERFSVKPGITGWAQVSYGYGATVEDAIEKLNYELFYIKNMSFFMDLIVVMKTVKTVLFGKGAR
ncbi:MAG: TIGR03013 family XrtA/PEP-CTERM system glycosyltransferase [Pseudomonadota bacterium]